uniref:NADH dehydrogenase subunit 2 n=1 Tax=Neoperla bimaculata TaxID=2908267 RepID=UPI001EE1244E|nr:NADH dehydrogenase subunit 2 [Neoperla bimaculata]UIF93984.1 NADH dehydrogenase subunit 2 [Neoperla bimaculata]
MINNLSKLLFLTTLILGTLISISSSSWFSAWVGLEINLLSFIPLMTRSSNIMPSEAALKYFLTQALASATLLCSIILSALLFAMPNAILTLNLFVNTLISSSLLLKMGAAPFHFWFPGVMEGLNWNNGLILMTWQKIAPLILLSYILTFSMFSSFIIISSILIGSLGGLNQTSLRKILAYSSINHLGWLISALIIGESLWNIYFISYSFLTASVIFMLNSLKISHLNQTFNYNSIHPVSKFFLFSTLLSLGGLPPFLGFFPKWVIIQNMTELNLTSLVVAMVIMTLITLFYYIRITFSAFLLSYTENLWNTLNSQMTLSFYISVTLGLISALGLCLSTLIFNLF